MIERPIAVSEPWSGVTAGQRLQRLVRRVTSVGLRIRVLGWFVVLAICSSAVMIVGFHEILRAQLSTEIDGQLAQEMAEFRTLAGGRAATDLPLGYDSAAGVVDAFLRRDIPDEDEAFYALVDGQPYAETRAPVSLFQDTNILAAWRTATTVLSGSVDTAVGPVLWRAEPLETSPGRTVVFAAALFEANRYAQLDRTIQLVVLLAAAVILMGVIPAWAAAGRAIAPLRSLAATARTIGDGGDLAVRIPVEGAGEVAQLARTLDTMLHRLDAAFRSQRQFLSDISHELRTPLTIMRGNLELLDEDQVASRQTLEVVLAQVDRMSRYVSDLLFIARAEHPDFLRRGPVALDAFVNSLPGLVRSLGERDWRFVVPQPTTIYADADRLTQAILDLAANAVRYTEPPDVIELGASVDGACARFWVRDEGTGIALEDQRRLFQRFARGRDRRTTASEGTGLGLAIVHAIAVAHGGRTDLESAVGVGSTFSLVIPVGVPRTAVAA